MKKHLKVAVYSNVFVGENLALSSNLQTDSTDKLTDNRHNHKSDFQLKDEILQELHHVIQLLNTKYIAAHRLYKVQQSLVSDKLLSTPDILRNVVLHVHQFIKLNRCKFHLKKNHDPAVRLIKLECLPIQPKPAFSAIAFSNTGALSTKAR